MSDDPAVEEDFYADSESFSYHLCLTNAFQTFAIMAGCESEPDYLYWKACLSWRNGQPRSTYVTDSTYFLVFQLISPAIRLIHGSADRVTSHLGTIKLFDRLPNEDKEVEIYEGYEHSESQHHFSSILMSLVIVMTKVSAMPVDINGSECFRSVETKQTTRRDRGYSQIGGTGFCSDASWHIFTDFDSRLIAYVTLSMHLYMIETA